MDWMQWYESVMVAWRTSQKKRSRSEIEMELKELKQERDLLQAENGILLGKLIYLLEEKPKKGEPNDQK